MTTYAYFALTDGTTTLTFANGSAVLQNYALAHREWAPAVAHRRVDALGALGDWEDVLETIGIIITGSTAAKDCPVPHDERSSRACACSASALMGTTRSLAMATP